MALWYYVKDGQQTGPIEETEFRALVDGGTVTPSTLVWCEGMANWELYGQIGKSSAGTDTEASGALEGREPCAECKRLCFREDMIQHGDLWVCASCKPLFIQRMLETGVAPGTLPYAGFWIRFCAKFIDGIILQVAVIALLSVFANPFMPPAEVDPNNPFSGLATMFSLTSVLSMLFGHAIGITYMTFFLGKFGATPGKMLCRLRVVRPDGSKISYLQAFGRYFAEIVSTVILYFGYIMVVFDDEKRALHDRMCGTRVIKV